MEVFTNIATGFIGLFNAGGKVFLSYMTGIIPLLIALITAVNALVKFIGEGRVNHAMSKLTRFAILRYTFLPIISVFFFTNPMCYTAGRFLPERYKPAFYDSCVSFVHPITGLFPHANSAELFVFLGIANGFVKAGGQQAKLALLYALTGLVVILIRGIVTEKISIFFFKRNKNTTILDGSLDVNSLKKNDAQEA
ncbi:PTS glucitol/sorbitol transporter subunit IIC [Lacticaseibacillus paracasei]|uniref:PTS glucitol/sorbitol transporter subunit IIC n=1 Tax=Lacticaseibacillus paracasei TaxID=1597 RepID=UPI0007BEB7D9|nr:PTS glucitol/sorbitol transporter subunit IIC [Lacticaseibacillus paracasei]URW91773.1 PTS glucitol/sorbitol transporter subunit IIC [Lacticaseibacillus paracasei]